MRLGTRLECVGSLPRELGACQNGGKEFAGRRLRLARRLSGVVEKLVRSWEGLTMMVKMSYRPDMDPRSSLGIRPRFRRCDGSSSGVR
ncbi:hypothetical protein GW17_00061695 [Ensete ventricosum]|nr:hypothetical protein GW17_00061695 [Ensete ventricosum]